MLTEEVMILRRATRAEKAEQIQQSRVHFRTESPVVLRRLQHALQCQ